MKNRFSINGLLSMEVYFENKLALLEKQQKCPELRIVFHTRAESRVVNENFREAQSKKFLKPKVVSPETSSKANEFSFWPREQCDVPQENGDAFSLRAAAEARAPHRGG